MKKQHRFLEESATALKKSTAPAAPNPGKPGLDAAAKKEAAPSEDPAAAADPNATPGASASSGGDVASDIELFKRLIADHIGSDESPSDDLVSTTKEMYQAACDSGMGHEDALRHAGAGLKMAKIMGDKHAKSSEETKKKEVAPMQDENDKPKEAPAEEAKKEAAAEPAPQADAAAAPIKESESATIARLTGENATLRESIKKTELASHLDKVCRESGLSVAVTKSFRELVKTAKTADEINSTWKHFKSAIDGVKETSRASMTESGFSFAIPEKVMVNLGDSSSGSEAIKTTGFSDCVS